MFACFFIVYFVYDSYNNNNMYVGVGLPHLFLQARTWTARSTSNWTPSASSSASLLYRTSPFCESQSPQWPWLWRKAKNYIIKVLSLPAHISLCFQYHKCSIATSAVCYQYCMITLTEDCRGFFANVKAINTWSTSLMDTGRHLNLMLWYQNLTSLFDRSITQNTHSEPKKRAALFFTKTPVFLGGFLYFLHQWKQEKILYSVII